MVFEWCQLTKPLTISHCINLCINVVNILPDKANHAQVIPRSSLLITYSTVYVVYRSGILN